MDRLRNYSNGACRATGVPRVRCRKDCSSTRGKWRSRSLQKAGAPLGPLFPPQLSPAVLAGLFVGWSRTALAATPALLRHERAKLLYLIRKQIGHRRLCRVRFPRCNRQIDNDKSRLLAQPDRLTFEPFYQVAANLENFTFYSSHRGSDVAARWIAINCLGVHQPAADRPSGRGAR